MWAINAMAPMRVIRAAWPHLLASGTGRVVNIASLSGKRVRNDNTGYAMSKFALMALTQAVRREGFSRGVRACALSPGFVATDMTMAADFARDQMTSPADLAEMAHLLLHLPNNASVAELLVNCRLEAML
jgi:NAD(P)-dependent dehydrogenase (short-subunit alcohol dehydrogenase family)